MFTFILIFLQYWPRVAPTYCGYCLNNARALDFLSGGFHFESNSDSRSLDLKFFKTYHFDLLLYLLSGPKFKVSLSTGSVTCQ
ncbi:hypothetical protein MKW98_008308, partial [Papaver atlanticum]